MLLYQRFHSPRFNLWHPLKRWVFCNSHHGRLSTINRWVFTMINNSIHGSHNSCVITSLQRRWAFQGCPQKWCGRFVISWRVIIRITICSREETRCGNTLEWRILIKRGSSIEVLGGLRPAYKGKDLTVWFDWFLSNRHVGIPIEIFRIRRGHRD